MFKGFAFLRERNTPCLTLLVFENHPTIFPNTQGEKKKKLSFVLFIPVRPPLLVDTHCFPSNYSSITVTTVLLGLEDIAILFIY